MTNVLAPLVKLRVVGDAVPLLPLLLRPRFWWTNNEFHNSNGRFALVTSASERPAIRAGLRVVPRTAEAEHVFSGLSMAVGLDVQGW